METLVLSGAFLPIERVSWERAVTLWVLGKVEIIASYTDRVVRSVTFEMPMPKVIRHRRYVRAPLPRTKLTRANLYRRDGGACQYCGRALRKEEATIDHVIPRALGGTTRWENVVIACQPCNQRKGARTPERASMTLRSTPRRPQLSAVVLHDGEAWSEWL